MVPSVFTFQIVLNALWMSTNKRYLVVPYSASHVVVAPQAMAMMLGGI